MSALLVLFLLLAGLTSTELIKNESTSKDKKAEKPATSSENGQVNSQVTTGNSSAEVKVENKTEPQPPSNSQSNSSNPGTCKVTKNGVTTTVPADEVNINETGPGDKNIKVECDNKQSTSTNNGSNQSSIENKVKIDVNTSNN